MNGRRVTANRTASPLSRLHIMLEVSVVKPVVRYYTDLRLHDSEPQHQQSTTLETRTGIAPHELAYQEMVVQERENEIREIQRGIHEITSIFQSLGSLTSRQGEILGTSSYSLFPLCHFTPHFSSFFFLVDPTPRSSFQLGSRFYRNFLEADMILRTGR